MNIKEAAYRYLLIVVCAKCKGGWRLTEKGYCANCGGQEWILVTNPDGGSQQP